MKHLLRQGHADGAVVAAACPRHPARAPAIAAFAAVADLVARRRHGSIARKRRFLQRCGKPACDLPRRERASRILIASARVTRPADRGSGLQHDRRRRSTRDRSLTPSTNTPISPYEIAIIETTTGPHLRPESAHRSASCRRQPQSSDRGSDRAAPGKGRPSTTSRPGSADNSSRTAMTQGSADHSPARSQTGLAGVDILRASRSRMPPMVAKTNPLKGFAASHADDALPTGSSIAKT